NTLLLSTTLMSAGSIACAFSQDLNAVMVGRFITGLGAGAEVPIAGAMFNEFLRGRIRGGVVMVYESAFGWGGLIVPWIALLLIAVGMQDIAWRVLFGLAGLSIVFLVFRRWVLPESPRWLVN